MKGISALLITFLVRCGAAVVLKASAWQSAGKYPTSSDFPEESLASVNSRPSTAIAFTGGGARAYLAAVGYLAGLHSLNLMPKVRYISGISGGSWATLAYSFSQLNISDDILLGPVTQPGDITEEGLKEMDSRCLRKATEVAMTLVCLKALTDGKVSSLADSWAYGTQMVYFDPFGIPAGLPFSWSADVVKDIKARNPSLRNIDFVLPTNADRPFPMVGTTLVGPSEGGGYPYDTRNFTMIEISPLTVGQMMTTDVLYHYQSDIIDRPRYRTVGGAIETFAFGRYGDSPILGLGEGNPSDALRVPEPTSYLDLQFAGAASSYAPGAFVESFPHFNIAENLGLHMSYWSPVDKLPDMKDTLFADGGSYMNIMLPSMLQRRIRKIVLFLNEGQSLMPASSWNPATDVPSASQVSDTLSSLFGVVPDDAMDYTWQKRSFDISKNQYFSETDWAPVAIGLQNAQAEGNGIIYSANLTTIENSWWGIPAGITSEITFVYLGRLKGWEAELQSDVYPLFVPSDPEDAQNLGIDVSSGPFKGFPHYMTTGGLVNNERANALSDLTAWTITKNEKLFREILS